MLDGAKNSLSQLSLRASPPALSPSWFDRTNEKRTKIKHSRTPISAKNLVLVDAIAILVVTKETHKVDGVLVGKTRVAAHQQHVLVVVDVGREREVGAAADDNRIVAECVDDEVLGVNAVCAVSANNENTNNNVERN